MTSLEQYNKELYHYGIKGMKWGVVRDRKSANKFAKDWYKQTKRDGSSTKARRSLSESDEVVKLYNSKDLKDARNEVRKYDKIERDFYNNEKLLDKYQRIMAKETSKKYGMSFDDALRGYKYDDFDQGDTFERYLKDTKKFDSFYSGRDRAFKQYDTARKKAVDSYLGEYGDTPVKSFYSSKYIGNGKNHITTSTMSDIFESALNTRFDYNAIDRISNTND